MLGSEAPLSPTRAVGKAGFGEHACWRGVQLGSCSPRDEMLLWGEVDYVDVCNHGVEVG